jgi:hypothetical protein
MKQWLEPLFFATRVIFVITILVMAVSLTIKAWVGLMF